MKAKRKFTTGHPGRVTSKFDSSVTSYEIQIFNEIGHGILTVSGNELNLTKIAAESVCAALDKVTR